MSGKEQKGEGSYEGTRQYNKATKEFLDTHDVDKLGKEAERAVEKDDGCLKRAEEKGKAPARK